MKRSTIIIASVLTIATLTISCKSTSEAKTAKPERTGQQKGGDRPNLETIFTELDTNKDGKISKSEAKGPLAESFSKIDTNEDGFISKEELKNAPKPERKERPRN
jgi:Ca2+-binding EF-hand superfamily protein